MSEKPEPKEAAPAMPPGGGMGGMGYGRNGRYDVVSETLELAFIQHSFKSHCISILTTKTLAFW